MGEGSYSGGQHANEAHADGPRAALDVHSESGTPSLACTRCRIQGCRHRTCGHTARPKRTSASATPTARPILVKGHNSILDRASDALLSPSSSLPKRAAEDEEEEEDDDETCVCSCVGISTSSGRLFILRGTCKETPARGEFIPAFGFSRAGMSWRFEQDYQISSSVFVSAAAS